VVGQDAGPQAPPPLAPQGDALAQQRPPHRRAAPARRGDQVGDADLAGPVAGQLVVGQHLRVSSGRHGLPLADSGREEWAGLRRRRPAPVWRPLQDVRVAQSGPEGVAVAREWRPDVVVCDIGLPGLDGFGVAGELRRDAATAHVHLIALTAYGDEATRERARQCGFDNFLTKPADPSLLLQLLTGRDAPA